MTKNFSCEEQYKNWAANSNLEAKKWGFAITGGLITVATVIFNTAVIIRLRLKSRHKYFTKFFITSLAVADLFVGVIVVPFSIYGLFHSTASILGDRTCDIMNSIDITLSTVSIYHLLTLAFERFIALYKPLSYRKICTKKSRIIFFILNWTIPAILGFGAVLPKLNESKVEHIANCFREMSSSCFIVMNIEFSLIITTISIFIPMLLLIGFNTSICVIVRKQTHFQNSARLSSQPHSQHKHSPTVHRRAKTPSSFSPSVCNREHTRRFFSKETRVAVTVAIMTGVFILCWLPFFIFNMVSVVSLYLTVPGYVYLICTWLGYANSAANPIVFLVLELRK